MKFEHVPMPVGTQNVDPNLMMMLSGIAIAAMLVAVSAPRLFALAALAGGAVAGSALIG